MVIERLFNLSKQGKNEIFDILIVRYPANLIVLDRRYDYFFAISWLRPLEHSAKSLMARWVSSKLLELQSRLTLLDIAQSGMAVFSLFVPVSDRVSGSFFVEGGKNCFCAIDDFCFLGR